jgi:hypothetical protein
MAKRRTGKQEVADFTQNYIEEHWIDAMPIRIDFWSRPAYVKPQREGQDVRFSPCPSPAEAKLFVSLNKLRTSRDLEGKSGALKEFQSGNPYAAESRDAYEVLHAFLAVNSPEKVPGFLRLAGEFWPLHSFTWSEFQRIQHFVRLVSNSDFPDSAASGPDTHQAGLALYGLPNTFFPVHREDPLFDTTCIERFIELNPDAAEELAREQKTARERDAKALRELPQGFLRTPGSAVSEDYHPTERAELLLAIEELDLLEREAAKVFSELRRTAEPAEKESLSTQYTYIKGLIEKAKVAQAEAAEPLTEKEQHAVMVRRARSGTTRLERDDFMPIRHIRARNVLEAMGAVVCVLRLQGVRTRICRHCQNQYAAGDPRNTYCSKKCKNAATTIATRKREKAEKLAQKERDRMLQSTPTASG